MIYVLKKPIEEKHKDKEILKKSVTTLKNLTFFGIVTVCIMFHITFIYHLLMHAFCKPITYLTLMCFGICFQGVFDRFL